MHFPFDVTLFELGTIVGKTVAAHDGFAGTVFVERMQLSDDPDTAVAQTIAQMARFVVADSASAPVAALARSLCGATSFDTIRNVWEWIHKRVTFSTDQKTAGGIRGIGSTSNVVEVLIRPADLLAMRSPQGDCDDFSMLGAALLRAAGVRSEFVTVAADSRNPSEYSHVYLHAIDGGGKRWAFDSSHGSYCGWEVPNNFNKKQFWSVETGMPLMQAGGLAGLGFDSGTTTSTPWWQQVVNTSIPSVLDVFKARYGVPPAGTVIQTPTGMISRGTDVSASNYGVNVGMNPYGTGSFSVPGWVWLVVGLVAIVLIAGGKGRR